MIVNDQTPLNDKCWKCDIALNICCCEKNVLKQTAEQQQKHNPHNILKQLLSNEHCSVFNCSNTMIQVWL
jgi:hypothetical protein